MGKTRWLITQPNGRSYVTEDNAKALIAHQCGYAVELIVPACG